ASGRAENVRRPRKTWRAEARAGQGRRAVQQPEPLSTRPAARKPAVASTRPEGADTGYAEGTPGAGEIQIIGTQAAERIQRQAGIGAEFAQARPAQWRAAGMAGGGGDRRQRGEIAADLRRHPQFV